MFKLKRHIHQYSKYLNYNCVNDQLIDSPLIILKSEQSVTENNGDRDVSTN